MSAESELDKKLKGLLDEESLTTLLHTTDDLDDRRKIRAAIREAKKRKQTEQEAASRSNRARTSPAAPELNLDGIDDENKLRELLDKTEDAQQKKKIQAAIKELRRKAREAAEEVISKEEKDYAVKHVSQDPIIEVAHDDIPGVKVDSDASAGDWNQSEVIDIEQIDDIAILERMLGTTDEFGERSQIRARIKVLHDHQLDLDVPDYPEVRRLSENLDAVWLDERGRRRSSVIDRAALEELTSGNVEAEENIAYDEIEDVDELQRLLEKANDIGEKRLIRSALGELKKKLAGNK